MRVSFLKFRLFGKAAFFLCALFGLLLLSPLPASAVKPSLVSATVDVNSGRTIVLTFDQALSAAGNAADYSLSGSVQGQIQVSSPIRLGTNIRLSVGSVVQGGQTVTLTYIPSTNVPANGTGESVEAFTTTVANPGAAIVPRFGWEDISVGSTNKSVISLMLNMTVTCNLSTSNFEVKVNGSPRSITNVQGCDTVNVTLATPIESNDVATISYIPSSGSIRTIFGTPAAAHTDAKIYGIPDTIAPVISVPSTSTHQFGQGGSITVSTNEPAGFNVSSDRTLSFQISSTGKNNEVVLLVSSILPVGTYTVGLTAADDAGNVTTRNITVNITALAPTPTPTPIATPKPTATTPVPPKSTVYKTCQLLNKKYPGGVATSYAARNKGTGMNYIPRVDSAVYKANIKLDKDKDGIACER
jgi:uncharacterized repeat protein (TIGR02059 family)